MIFRKSLRSILLSCSAFMALSGLAAAPAMAQTGNVSEQYLFAAANRDRVEHGLAPLRFDGLLSQAALNHAREMAAQETISHQFSGEADLAARAGRAGVRFSLVTENVAEASNAAQIHDLWMQSAGHRANLLDAKINAVGIAVVSRRGQLYAVEDFARTVERLSLVQQEAKVAALVATAGVKILPDPGDARQTCQMSRGFGGLRQPRFVMRYSAADLSRLPEELNAKLASGRYREAEVGACTRSGSNPFTSYNVAVLLYP